MLTLEAVLFDLDGTLLDTAPDMVGALNDMRRDDALAPLAYAQGRTQVSNGALGLIRVGYPDAVDEERLALRDRFLARYAERVAEETVPFPGILDVLDALETSQTPWGVVTNKPGALTEAVLNGVGLASRCACVVSGDTLTRRKPHPDPLLHAARALGARELNSVYVGDAARDIQAGRAAGMLTIAATYGYLDGSSEPADWDADFAIDHPDELLPVLERLGRERRAR